MQGTKELKNEKPHESCVLKEREKESVQRNLEVLQILGYDGNIKYT